MNKQFVNKTKDNKIVSIYTNYFEQHGAAHPEITLEDIAEAVSKITLGDNKFLIAECYLSNKKFSNNCIEINANSVVEWRQRPNRTGFTPFVIGAKPEKTNKIVVGICYDDPNKGGDGQMTIFTAFGGILAPKEPWDANIKTPEEREKSLQFWGNPETKTKGTHALCE